MATWEVTFVGEAGSGLSASQIADIEAGVIAAGQHWDRYLASSNAIITVEVDLTAGADAASGASATSVFIENNNGGQFVFREGAAHELLTGFDPNGDNLPDINLTLPANYFLTTFADPNPAARSATVPDGDLDLQSVLIHEIGHAIGFNGFSVDNIASLPNATSISAFEDNIVFDNGAPFFNGAAAAAIYGGPVAITTADTNNAAHIGNPEGGLGADLIPDLMNGVTFFTGVRYFISPLDTAILADTGLTLRAPTAGADELYGYDAIDPALAAAVPLAVPSFYNGRDVIDAGAGNDLVFGLSGADELRGNNGNDTLHGGDGNDTLYGNINNDQLFGNAGVDRLLGGDGDDTLRGGDGNDSLGGEAGADWHYGEAGNDFARGRGGSDTLFGGTGNDTLIGDAGRDVLLGEAGADLLRGGIGPDVLRGGDGNDTLLGENAHDKIFANKGDDVARGGFGDDLIFGGFGNDRVEGNEGNDRVNGEGGDDDIYGGAGDDTLLGREGTDTLFGGAGDDVFIFEPGEGVDVIRDFKAGAGSEDVIDLSAFGADFDSFAEVFAAASQNGPNTVIDFGNGDRLSLWNLDVSSLHADDFIFG